MAAYGDLGKNARKTLSEGYNGHSASLSVTHGLPGDCSVTTSTAIDTQTSSNNYSIDLATKLSSKDKGLVIVDKRGINKEWTGSHSLVASVANFCDVKNMTFTVDHKGKINIAYKNNFLNESVDYIQETQTLKPTVCLSQDGIAAGVQTTISLQSGTEHGPKSTSVAAGYLGKTIQGHVHADNDGAKLGFTLWGCLDKIEGAIEASQVVENNDKQCEVGARYNIASDFFIGGKINTNKKVGICMKKGLTENLSASTSISTLLSDYKNIEIGAGVDFSHNFEFFSGSQSTHSMELIGNENENNKLRTQQISSSTEKRKMQRIGATSKELGQNCTDRKCLPAKKYWE